MGAGGFIGHPESIEEAARMLPRSGLAVPVVLPSSLLTFL